MKLRQKRIEDVVFGQTPITAPKEMSVREAVALFNKHDIGCIVIEEQGNTAGIFTERDFVRRIAEKQLDLDQATLGEYMTPNPICHKMDTLVLTSLIRMKTGKFRHIVIIDENQAPIGVLSIKDITSYLLDRCADGCPNSH